MSSFSRLYLFDFCGTIYNSNTTLDFLKYIKGKNSIIYDIKFLILWIVAKILKDIKIISDHGYTKLRLLSLKGLAKSDLDIYAKKFLIELESMGKLNVEIYNLLINNHQDGKEVVIISFTIQNILNQFLILHKVNFKAFGSSLELNNFGKLTGKYDQFIPELGKVNFLKNKIDEKELEEAFFITDDEVADKDLINFVKETKIVG